MFINPFEPYFPIEAELHVINHPINSAERRVVKNRFVALPRAITGEDARFPITNALEIILSFPLPRPHGIEITPTVMANLINVIVKGGVD